MKTICIYVDEGTSFEVLLREVAQELDHASAMLRPVLAEDLVEYDCLHDANVFVMPGGEDLPYCTKLNGNGNVGLRRFVEAGGSYLGICAGAYYGCRALRFHAGQQDEICEPRELAFVDATAVGSLSELGPFYDLTIASASVSPIRWDDIGTFRCYYHGGPRFELSSEESATVFARYPEAKDAPAGIECRVGAGNVLLVGVHLEMTATALARRLAQLQDGYAYRHLATLLADNDGPRRLAFRNLLQRAGIPLKSAPQAG